MFEMETVVEHYPGHSLCLGANTIRSMASGKYDEIAPGDIVYMRYVVKAGDEDPLAEERLRVSSVAIAPFRPLVAEHWCHNHAGLAFEDQLLDVLMHLYGVDSEHTGLFAAIYFEG